MEILTWQDGILFLAALVGGAVNAVAGGGTFLTFPILVFTGLPPLIANATNTFALWPGSVASAIANRAEMAAHKAYIPLLVFISITGGFMGAILLLFTPQALFTALVPYLLLAATLIFTFGTRVIAWMRAHRGAEGSYSPHPKRMALLHYGIAVYGGYFGAGIGILMLAMLELMQFRDIHSMNALKTMLATCINAVAVLSFALAGIIVWKPALIMAAGAIVGGYGMAKYARRIPQRYLRFFISFTGFSLSAYFFLS